MVGAFLLGGSVTMKVVCMDYDQNKNLRRVRFEPYQKPLFHACSGAGSTSEFQP